VSVETPDRDPAKWHPLLRERWPKLAGRLLAAGIRTMIWEGYRSGQRQAWLYGQGRTPEDLRLVGVNPGYARSGGRVTNAYSARLSAHGWELPDGTPAAAALDLVPIGPDGRPWSLDDRWIDFVQFVAISTAETGLRHFSKPGKPPWDRPHVQLVEWSDPLHRLVLNDG
jgi:hypothetical protein